MTHRKFQLFNVAGATAWVVGLVAAGFYFGNIPLLHDHLNAIALIGVASAVLPLVLSAAWKMFKSKKITKR